MSQIPDMSFSNEWETIREIIRNGNRFLITTHVNADPDGLGSELALAEGLRSLNKESVILNPTTLSRHFAFLDPKHEVQVYSNENQNLAEAGFDGIFIIDISRWERLGLLSDPIRFCGKPKICIDHHPYTGGYADHHLVNVN